MLFPHMGDIVSFMYEGDIKVGTVGARCGKHVQVFVDNITYTVRKSQLTLVYRKPDIL